jgi:hypothetical protein
MVGGGDGGGGRTHRSGKEWALVRPDMLHPLSSY